MPKKPQASRNAVIYLRISLDPGGEGAGVARQRTDCERICKQRGWKVAHIVDDNDESASRYRRGVRKKWVEVLELLDNGGADALVAYDLDRITRQPRDLEDLIDRCEKGLPVVTAQGTLHLDTADGRAMARVLVTMAAKASDDTSRRVRRMKLDLAQAGKPTGGVRAFGWTHNGTVHEPKEAQAIRDGAAQILSGGSLKDLARTWNAAGFKTRGGGRGFTANSVRLALVNPRHGGFNVHRGEVIGRGAWKPILDRSTYERLHKLLTDPNRARTPSRRTAFTGLFKCGRCGCAMTRDSTGTTRVWRCKRLPGYPQCGRVSVKADAVERVVTQSLFAALDSPKLSKAMRPKQSLASDSFVELDEVEQRRNDLAAMFADGSISRSEWMTARGPLEARYEALRAAAARTQRTVVLDAELTKPGALRAAWADMSEDRQRSILTAIIERVDVAAAASSHSLAEDRVAISWRV